MKMEGVLEKVNDLGFFKTAPEFYVMWADHYATMSNRKQFENIMKLCKDNCSYDAYQIDEYFGFIIALRFMIINILYSIFRPIIRKYYADTTMDVCQDNTAALFNCIAHTEKSGPAPVPRSVQKMAPPVVFQAPEVAATEAQPNLENPKPKAKEDFSVFCEPTILQAESMMPEVTSTMTGLSQAINKNRRMSVFILHFYMNLMNISFIDIPRWGMRCHCCRAACPL
jgi:hypothetical protein